MKELKLRKDYPNFDWNKNADRQQAHHALIYRENTSLFKKTVWNDIVDCLKNALVEVGLTWSDEFGSYEDTKFELTSSPVNFTARRFNAISHNVKVVINSTFIWQYDTNYEGFVGRDNYRGFTETLTPDTVYGSALIELTRKVNLLIDILKDEANTLNKASNTNLEASSNTILSVPELSAFDTFLVETLKSDVTVSNHEAAEFSINESVEFKPQADIKLKHAGGTIRVNLKNYSFYDAVMELERLYSNLYSTIYHLAVTNAKLIINYNSVKLRAEVPSVLTETSNMDFADIGRLVANSILNALTDATLGNVEPLDLETEYLSQMIAEALVSVKGKRLLKIRLKPEMTFTASIDNYKGLTFVSITAHILRNNANAITRVARKASSQITCEAIMSIPDLIRCVANPMLSEYIDCVCNIENEMVKGVATNTGSDVDMMADILSLMKKGKARKTASTVNCILSESGEIEKTLIRLLSYTKEHKANISSEAKRFQRLLQESVVASKFRDNIRLDLCISGSTLEVISTFLMGGDSNLDAINYGDDYLKTNTAFELYFDSDITSLEATSLEINEVIYDSGDVSLEVLNTAESMQVDVKAFEVVIPNTNISIVSLTSIVVGNISHDAFSFADITFDEASWYNPVQIENLLEIYQVYGAEQVAGNLDIQ